MGRFERNLFIAHLVILHYRLCRRSLPVLELTIEGIMLNCSLPGVFSSSVCSLRHIDIRGIPITYVPAHFINCNIRICMLFVGVNGSASIMKSHLLFAPMYQRLALFMRAVILHLYVIYHNLCTLPSLLRF